MVICVQGSRTVVRNCAGAAVTYTPFRGTIGIKIEQANSIPSSIVRTKKGTLSAG